MSSRTFDTVDVIFIGLLAVCIVVAVGCLIDLVGEASMHIIAKIDRNAAAIERIEKNTEIFGDPALRNICLP